MFKGKYKAANDRLFPSDEAFNRVLGDIREPDAASAKKRVLNKRENMRVTMAWALCALMVVPAAIGIISKSASKNDTNNGVWTLSLPSSYTQNQISDYSEAFSRITANRKGYSYEAYMQMNPDVVSILPNAGDVIFYSSKNENMEWVDFAVTDDRLTIFKTDGDVKGQEPISAEVAPGNPAPADHSDTNKQVEGVDEADVIKTDGSYIYVLNSEGVTILSAAGDKTRVLGRIKTDELPTHSDNAKAALLAMYVNGDQLIVIAQENQKYEYDAGVSNGYYVKDSYDMYYNESITVAHICDITDVSAPVRVSTLCQDGSYIDSRLTNGKLYIISNYGMDSIIYEENVATYVPCVYDGNGEGRLTPVQDIYIMPIDDKANTDYCYTYITELDMSDTSDYSKTLAMLGYVNTVYCSGANLLLCRQEYNSESKEIYCKPVDGEEFSYTISDADNGGKKGTYFENYISTELYRIPIGGDRLAVAAQATVRGALLNQFAIDEYEDCFRIVVTRDEYENAHTSTDYEYEGSTYSAQTDIFDNNTRSNSLYVLDMGLETVGAIENIAEDEMVKSVRFMGDIGYFVTFRQTDPLFSVDLSTPTKPRILGELKIPGFSEYLQAWGDGMLFGFGQSADEETGETECLKLSMFDVTDPANVYESNSKKLEKFSYSTASYNHKAILVAYTRGLIGFPADNGYLLYSYSEDSGFTQRAYIELEGKNRDYPYSADMRGMYIGECYYVIDYQNSNIVAIDLNTFEAIGNISY